MALGGRTLLTGSILFHIVHATVWLDFWSIWVGPKDFPEFKAEIFREMGHDVPGPKPGEYPLGNRRITSPLWLPPSRSSPPDCS